MIFTSPNYDHKNAPNYMSPLCGTPMANLSLCDEHYPLGDENHPLTLSRFFPFSEEEYPPPLAIALANVAWSIALLILIYLSSRCIHSKAEESLRKDLMTALNGVDSNQFFTNGDEKPKRYGPKEPRENLYESNREESEETVAEPGEACAVCLDNKRTMIAIPCGHYNFCSPCAEVLSVSRKNTCPICRTAVCDYVIVRD
jgi:hypothetical protein